MFNTSGFGVLVIDALFNKWVWERCFFFFWEVQNHIKHWKVSIAGEDTFGNQALPGIKKTQKHV